MVESVVAVVVDDVAADVVTALEVVLAVLLVAVETVVVVVAVGVALVVLAVAVVVVVVGAGAVVVVVVIGTVIALEFVVVVDVAVVVDFRDAVLEFVVVGECGADLWALKRIGRAAGARRSPFARAQVRTRRWDRTACLTQGCTSRRMM